MEVARELQKRGVHVNFLGLYDAVDMALGFGEAETIPSNVGQAAHAMGRSTVQSRVWFNTADHGPEDRSKRKGYSEQIFYATHAGIGGAPWAGDRPAGKPWYGMSKDIDEKESARVDAWMRARAAEAGLRLDSSKVVPYRGDPHVVPPAIKEQFKKNLGQ